MLCASLALMGSEAQQTRSISGQSYTIGYDFDEEGNLLSMTYPSGRTVAYDINNANEITAISTNGAPASLPDMLSFADALTAVQVDLLAGTAAGGAVGADLTGILNLTGSSFDDMLTGNNSDNTLFGGDGGDTVNADAGNDTVVGGAGNDTLYGNGGADTIEGGTGQDTINGGWAADRIIGGPGNDYLSGGPSGGDVYVFSIGDGNYDRVYDFSDGNETIEFLNTGLTFIDLNIVDFSNHAKVYFGAQGDMIRVNNAQGKLDASDFVFVENPPAPPASLEAVVSAITYKPHGPIASMLFGDGFTQTRDYDLSYRLTGFTDSDGVTSLRDIDHGYSTRNNLDSITDALGIATETLSYSPREFLKTASGPYGDITYAYDATGNRTERSVDSGSGPVLEAYAYPATDNRLASVTASGNIRSMTYDAAGNITYDARLAGGFGYAYNAANRMEEVTKDGILQASYLYNAEGQQVVRALAGGQTIHSMHNLDGQRIAEYGATGALLREYIWMGWMPVAVIESGQIHYIRTDHIERPVFATDATGTKVWDATYRPFGGVHTSTGTSEIRFLGQWFQSESGLHQNWMRDYDPTTGRYIQADPLGLVDGASVYGYAGQSPGRYVDPTGTLGQACLVPGVGQAACAKFVEVCVTAGTAALRYAFRKAVALGGSVILNNDCSGDGCGNADEEEVEEEGEDGDDFYDWTPHAEDAMMDEDISPDDVYDAIENPINVRSGSSSKGPTQVYEGKRATAVVNGDGVIVTVWR